MANRKRIETEQVIQVAIDLANTGGMASVTLAAVAERLSIRIPSLYHHVAGLPGLRDEMTFYAIHQLNDRLRRTAAGKSGEEAILSFAETYRAFAHDYPGIYALIQQPARSDQPHLAAEGQELIAFLSAILQAYHLDGDDLLHAIRALRSTVHGFVDLEVSGGFGLSLDKDESFRRLMQMFIRGIRQTA